MIDDQYYKAIKHESAAVSRVSTQAARVVQVFFVCFLATGCVSQEGISLGTSDWGAEQIVEQREKREAASDQNLPDVPDELIQIGKVSAFRPITEKNFDDIYSKYVEFAARMNPETSSSLTEVEFREQIAGWTKLKTITVPLLFSGYDYALVPNNVRDEIIFSDSFRTVMVQDSGDLVAAKTNADGYFLVVEKLCQEGYGYFECSGQYEMGLFDASTGEELSYGSLKPKKSGERIDPQTFKVIESD